MGAPRTASAFLGAAVALAIVLLLVAAIERAGAGAAEWLLTSWLVAAASRAAVVGLLLALTLAAPTARLPWLNMLLAAGAVWLLLPSTTQLPDVPSVGTYVAKPGLFYRTASGGRGFILADAGGPLQVGDTLRPAAALWLPAATAATVQPSELIRYGASPAGVVGSDGLRGDDGQLLVPADRRVPPAAAAGRLAQLPGAGAWDARTVLGELVELATAAAAPPTRRGRLIAVTAICFFFFSLRIFLRLTHWLAANILVTVLALRLAVGVTLAATPQVVPDLVERLPQWAAEPLGEHHLAVALVGIGMPLLVLDLLFSPLPGRSLGQLRGRSGAPQ